MGQTCAATCLRERDRTVAGTDVPLADCRSPVRALGCGRHHRTGAGLRYCERDLAVDALSKFWTTVLDDSDFTAGCPVLAATLEGDRLPAARAAAGEAFAHWERLWAELLEQAGVARERADSLASTAISAVEGAVILSRAERSGAPLERVINELHKLFDDALREAKPTDRAGAQPRVDPSGSSIQS